MNNIDRIGLLCEEAQAITKAVELMLKEDDPALRLHAEVLTGRLLEVLTTVSHCCCS